MFSKKGFVYLIADYDNDAYKIGVSKNKVSKRLKQLQTGNCTELVLLETYTTDYPYRMENILHNKYNHKKINNEWFALTNEDISNFKNTCSEIDAMIEIMKDNVFFNKNLK